MSNVHFIDTSVLASLLNIPGKNEHYADAKTEYEQLVQRGDTFVLPVAVLVETGNHIAHISDGRIRRAVAKKFAEVAKEAMKAESNWNIAPEIPSDVLQIILTQFPDQAMAGVGFGDVSIIEQFNDYWENRQPIGEMRIWSFDDHLSAHTKTGGLTRRKAGNWKVD